VSDASPYLLVELQVEDEPPPADVALLADRLYQYNATVSGWDNGRWLTILVRNEAGEIVAGLHGWTWGQTGFVQTLWVREDLRRAGLGERLLTTAEVEAVRRGCREMHLDTHSYQAPDFYRHRGYEVIGELPGWPDKTTRIFFRKALSDCPSALAGADAVAPPAR
jgi:ribosomal protein S18 acetylase RimI-like enzyme